MAAGMGDAPQVWNDEMEVWRQLYADVSERASANERDAERYRWRKENPAIEVEVFRGRYRCTARGSVLTDWLESYDAAIDAAMKGANA